MPPSGGSIGPEGGSGPGSPPSPGSSGRELEPWYSKTGTTSSERAHATASPGPVVRKVPAPKIPTASLSANSPGRTAGTNWKSKARPQKCERLCLKEPRTEESAAEHTTNITDITKRPVATVETVTHKSMARARAPVAVMGAWLTARHAKAKPRVRALRVGARHPEDEVGRNGAQLGVENAVSVS